jgi:hypothetical protein
MRARALIVGFLRSRAGRHLFCALVALVSGLLFLFSPPPQGKDRECHRYFRYSAWTGMMVNCDAWTYLVYAEDPRLLLTPNNERQSRPLHIVAGKVAGMAAYYLSGKTLKQPYFPGYWALNFILVYLALVLFLRLARIAEVDLALALAAAPVLACNLITKMFVWTPHSQIFNIFAPMFGVYLTALVLQRPRVLGPRDGAKLGLVLGVLGLAYGNFFALAPGLLVAAALRLRREGTFTPAKFLPPALYLTATAVLPTLIWIDVVTIKVGHYYNVEMAEFRQLIWVLDEARKGAWSLIAAMASNTWQFVQTFADQDVAVILSLTLVAIAVVMRLKRSRPIDPSAGAEPGREIVQAAGITFGCFFVFFWVLGFYQNRLTFTLVPPALLILVILIEQLASLSSRARSIARAALAGGTGVWCLYHVFSYGPF